MRRRGPSRFFRAFRRAWEVLVLADDGEELRRARAAERGRPPSRTRAPRGPDAATNVAVQAAVQAIVRSDAGII